MNTIFKSVRKRCVDIFCIGFQIVDGGVVKIKSAVFFNRASGKDAVAVIIFGREQRDMIKNTLHLKAPGNWINDPNGFIYYQGKYHLFYQHFPYAPVWGTLIPDFGVPCVCRMADGLVTDDRNDLLFGVPVIEVEAVF